MLKIARKILKAANGEFIVEVGNRGATFCDERGQSVTISLACYKDKFNWCWGQHCARCAVGALRRIVIRNGALLLECTGCFHQLRYVGV